MRSSGDGEAGRAGLSPWALEGQLDKVPSRAYLYIEGYLNWRGK
jgi:hypothetical protein